ncbi:transmembrane protein, putative (macronuclear) [Tetrahymena thermophila SB210]|uniref:Transmembrane protein, putative n=1 Tax=Tetrahymena thermophila (strain SB210) TaxID=312017 RepID=Q233L6_TETTS|nr:transmembrane protein, putative [Tetrahymena thermophila SB210]EAR91564.2 transmembrane protein, putative [Tetrahymena thermophila SB210]|eukprot:XP_001011809.2 transmembrane protein, putative [Tetrahymena thermophila SB210]
MSDLRNIQLTDMQKKNSSLTESQMKPKLKELIFDIEKKRIEKAKQQHKQKYQSDLLQYEERLKSFFQEIYVNHILIEQYRYEIYKNAQKQIQNEQSYNNYKDLHLKSCKTHIQKNVQEYYNFMINQNTSEKKDKPKNKTIHGAFNTFWFYLITILKIFFWPLTFIFYYCLYGERLFQLLKLLVRNCFPIFYFAAYPSSLRNQYQNKKKQNLPDNQEDCTENEEKFIFSDQLFFTNENCNQNQSFQKHTLYSFDSKDCSTYLLVFIFCNLCLASFVLNFIGIVDIAYNPDSLYSQIFGINFIILFYLLINSCANILICVQGNYLKFLSDNQELQDLMDKEDIIANNLYLNFMLDPIDINLNQSFEFYEQAFYPNRIQYDEQGKKINQNIIEMQEDVQEDVYCLQDQEILLKKKWVSGIGIFSQYLFQSSRPVADELPHVCKGYVKFYQKNYHPYNLRKILIKFYNNLFFPIILILIMALLTYNTVKQQNYIVNTGQKSILGAFWVNLILYILIQSNNRYFKKVFSNRLHALERLGLMISFDTKVTYSLTMKELPTMDIFCTKSLQTWLNLRVITMKYKIYSLNGWITLILLEILLLVIESLSQFVDSNGNIQYQLTKVNPYLRYLLIVALFQRITTFLIPSLIQQARINDQFNQHKQQLRHNLKEIKWIYSDIDQNFENSAYKELKQLSRQFNLFGIKQEVFSYSTKKALRRIAWYDFAQVDPITKKKIISESVSNDEFIKKERSYLKKLITKYEQVIESMDQNQQIHQIYAFGITPISFQILGVVLTFALTGFIQWIVSLLNDKAADSCNLPSN